MDAKLKTIAIVLGIIISTATIWATFGFPTPAMSSDIQALDRSFTTKYRGLSALQAQTAVEVFSGKVARLKLLLLTVQDPAAIAFLQGEVRKAEALLKKAEDTAIIDSDAQ